MLDLKHELERELSLIEPPDLWDRIEDAARHSADVAVVALPARHQRRPVLWIAVAAVIFLFAAVASSLARDSVQTLTTTPATRPQVGRGPASDAGLSTAKVQIVSCRGDSGIVTAGFVITKHSSAPSLNDSSDYIVRIKVVSENGPIGEAATVVRDVLPEKPKDAEAFAPITDTSRGGSVITNCFVEGVERLPRT